MKRNGFTLIELLIVVAVMALLIGLISGAVRHSIRNARKNRASAECALLESAIMTYWHDYGKFPIDKKKDNWGDSLYKHTYKEDNHLVFDRLHPQNNANPFHKEYLDENQLRAYDSGSKHIVPIKRVSGNSAYRESLVDPEGKPFKVTFDLKLKTVSVDH